MPKFSNYAKLLSPEDLETIINEIRDYYLVQNHSRAETIEFISGKYSILKSNDIAYIIRDHAKKTDRKLVHKAVEKTCLKRYGVTNPNKCPEILNKSRNTCLEKYGATNIFGSERFREISRERYGVDYPIQSEQIKEKERATCRKRYGVNYSIQSSIIRDRIRKTCLEKYGYENVFASPEIIEKSHATFKKNHGGRTCQSEVHYSDRTFEIINNKDRLKEYLLSIPFENRTIKYILDDLGDVSPSTLLYRIESFGLDSIYNKDHRGRYHFKYETEITEFISNLGVSQIVNGDCRSISPYEIDIYCPEYNIGIEFNGSYWHRESNKDSEYHQMKSMRAKTNNIFIYHIFEHEWNDDRKKKIICSQLRNLFLSNSTKIYARNCEVREVDSKTCRNFLNENHIQGYRNAKYKYGLYYNNELVSLMTFGQDRFILKSQISDNVYELVRFCTKLDTTVIGGASKLFKYFINITNPDGIISYCDIAKGRGITYEKLGFKLSKITKCNYWWYHPDTKRLFTRYQTQMKNEKEIMTNDGYIRIFDCGSYKYIWGNIVNVSEHNKVYEDQDIDSISYNDYLTKRRETIRNNHVQRKPTSEETKQKQRDAWKRRKAAGYEMSEITKAKISKTKRDKKLSKQHSDKTEKIISEANPNLSVTKKYRTRRSTGRFWINNGSDNKFISPDEFEKYSALGYIKGRYIDNSTKLGKIWVNNGIDNKQITDEELETYLNNGYIKGMLRRNKKGNSDENKIDKES